MSITERAKDMGVEDLVRENRKLKEERDRMKKDTMLDMKDINDLYNENRKLNEHIKELEEELWVRKHSYKKLMKDKELYERARDVMFWPEEEDLYEDL